MDASRLNLRERTLVQNLKRIFAGKTDAPASHTHAIADVTNLQSSLDGKAASSHQHSGSDITSGTVAPARLGSGTPSASNFLRGDGSWQAASGSSSLSYLEHTVGTNVVMLSANVYYDGPTVTLTAGTWLVTGHITVKSANATAQRITGKLWDGASTVWASGQGAAPSQGTGTAGYVNIPFTAIVVVASGTTVCKISAASTAANSVLLSTPGDNATGIGTTTSRLEAVKIA
jgi:hypothetical protein